MSSHFREARAAVALLLIGTIAGCDRENRESRGSPLPETTPASFQSDPRAAAYENNAFHIAQGAQYYSWMNCGGCHAHGGGGMGPPLMDASWRYGGSMERIVATIMEGRPNGMPSFRDRITEQQAWQLAAFVRSMSAKPRQDARPSRGDELSNREPLTLEEPEGLVAVDPKADQAKPR